MEKGEGIFSVSREDSMQEWDIRALGTGHWVWYGRVERRSIEVEV
jgi:hypothetical protein